MDPNQSNNPAAQSGGQAPQQNQNSQNISTSAQKHQETNVPTQNTPQQTQQKPVAPPPSPQSPSQPATNSQPQQNSNITNTPASAPSQTAAQPQQPQTAPPPPPPPKRGFPLKIVLIIAAIFAILSVGIIAVALLSGGDDNQQPVVNNNQVFAPSPTPQAGPREHVAEEYPDFQGIPVGENTVAFNKVDESFRIKYMGQIFHEQDTGSFLPREVFPENADQFQWYGLVETPDDVVGEPKLFSFKAPPTYRSFIFIMKWDREDGERYEMYRFQDNQVTKIEEFTKDRNFYVPIIDDFSLGGNFVSINIFSCPTCYDEEPEILLYHLPSGESRNIGRVSYFAWGDDDNAYEYKEYKAGVDPDTVPLRKNEFFVESTNILNPNN